METLGRMLIYLRGGITWSELVKTPLNTFRDRLPNAFFYSDYLNNLNFKKKPNYKFLRRKFRTLYINKGYLHDWVFNWTAKKHIGQSSKTATIGKGFVEQPDYGLIN